MTTDIVTAAAGGDLTRLPPLQRATIAFLAGYRESAATRTSYQADIGDWLAWCQEHHVDPAAATREDATRYAAMLATRPRPRTGRPLAASSISRHMSALSVWYQYLVDESVAQRNPLVRVRRPRVDRSESPTRGLTRDELAAWVRAAPEHTAFGATCALALAVFLADLGARVSEVCRADLGDLGQDGQHRTIRLHMKGGKHRTRPLPPDLAALIDQVTAGRTTGPIFLDPAGEPLSRQRVTYFVQQTALRAGITDWRRVTAHSLRHAWNTVAAERGATLEQRQHALGHGDPRTTQRYDHRRAALDNDPAYLVAAAVHPATLA